MRHCYEPLIIFVQIGEKFSFLFNGHARRQHQRRVVDVVVDVVDVVDWSGELSEGCWVLDEVVQAGVELVECLVSIRVGRLQIRNIVISQWRRLREGFKKIEIGNFPLTFFLILKKANNKCWNIFNIFN